MDSTINSVGGSVQINSLRERIKRDNMYEGNVSNIEQKNDPYLGEVGDIKQKNDVYLGNVSNIEQMIQQKNDVYLDNVSNIKQMIQQKNDHELMTAFSRATDEREEPCDRSELFDWIVDYIINEPKFDDVRNDLLERIASEHSKLGRFMVFGGSPLPTDEDEREHFE